MIQPPPAAEHFVHFPLRAWNLTILQKTIAETVLNIYIFIVDDDGSVAMTIMMMIKWLGGIYVRNNSIVTLVW